MKHVSRTTLLLVLSILLSRAVHAAPLQTLSADQQKTLTAVLTSNAAVQFCQFGGKEKIDAIAEVNGVRPNTLDVSLIKPTFDAIIDEIGRDKSAFCDRAWKLYGEEGAAFAGLLTRNAAMGSPVGEWAVVPTEEWSCQATRTSTDRTDTIFADFDERIFASIPRDLTLERGKKHPMQLEIADAKFDIDSDDLTNKGMIGFKIDDEVGDLLKRSDAFTLSVDDHHYRIRFGQGAEVLAKLDKCIDANHENSLPRQ